MNFINHDIIFEQVPFIDVEETESVVAWGSESVHARSQGHLDGATNKHTYTTRRAVCSD